MKGYLVEVLLANENGQGDLLLEWLSAGTVALSARPARMTRSSR
jgi:hypothetical protein